MFSAPSPRPGQIFQIAGKDGSGRIQLAASICAPILEDGGKVVWIDGTAGFHPLLAFGPQTPLESLRVLRMAYRPRQWVDRSERTFASQERQDGPALQRALVALDEAELVVLALPAPVAELSHRVLAQLRHRAEQRGASLLLITELEAHALSRRRLEQLGAFVSVRLMLRRDGSRRRLAMAHSEGGRLASPVLLSLGA